MDSPHQCFQLYDSLGTEEAAEHFRRTRCMAGLYVVFDKSLNSQGRWGSSQIQKKEKGIAWRFGSGFKNTQKRWAYILFQHINTTYCKPYSQPIHSSFHLKH